MPSLLITKPTLAVCLKFTCSESKKAALSIKLLLTKLARADLPPGNSAYIFTMPQTIISSSFCLASLCCENEFIILEEKNDASKNYFMKLRC
jgi:hypothetical protein